MRRLFMARNADLRPPEQGGTCVSRSTPKRKQEISRADVPRIQNLVLHCIGYMAHYL